MHAEEPRHVREGVRVVSVDEELVVQPQHRLERLLGGGRPLRDLLAPIHAHVVVHVPGLAHLRLGHPLQQERELHKRVKK